jgi:hypothetical protein
MFVGKYFSRVYYDYIIVKGSVYFNIEDAVYIGEAILKNFIAFINEYISISMIKI